MSTKYLLNPSSCGEEGENTIFENKNCKKIKELGLFGVDQSHQNLV